MSSTTLPDITDLMAMSDVAKKLGVALVTVHRWGEGGCRGVVLKTWWIGGRKFTTREAVNKFIAELNESDNEKLKREGC